MTKKQLIDYCLSLPSVYLDFPFDETTAVMRHMANSKMFALIDEKDGKVFINLKCEPARAEFLRSVYNSVVPGWHMNKNHWNTVYIGGDVSSEELFDMIAHSFELTAPKI